jgi:hemoglobin
MNDQSTTTLFQRMGGSAGIAALVDAMVARHMENPQVAVRFLPVRDEPERLAEIKRRSCAFLEMGSGGPARYDGRSMLEAHRGMNIGEAEYMAVVDDLLGAARDCCLDDGVQKELLFVAWSLKGEILRV